jgi:hypothetical protein
MCPKKPGPRFVPSETRNKLRQYAPVGAGRKNRCAVSAPLRKTLEIRKGIGTVNWKELNHAYGSAENIPLLLSQLSSFPDETPSEQEPWVSLWSSLYHQGDIYSASFASVPEIVKHLLKSPQSATFSFFALPASIEVARVKANVTVPSELSSAYFEAIRNLAAVAANWAGAKSDVLISQAAVAAFAVSVGQHGYAELALEIPPEEIPGVFAWYWER